MFSLGTRIYNCNDELLIERGRERKRKGGIYEDEPVKSNTARPDFQFEGLVFTFPSMAANGLRHANRHTRGHPRLLLVICAMKVSIYQYEALQQLE
jgi:hypothetical protein